MSEKDARFVGHIPENYDRYLGPLLFEPFAENLVHRLRVPPDGTVLEVACGTGVVTRRLRENLPSSASIVATDLNPPMLDYARAAVNAGTSVQWRQADAQALPFDDDSFNAILCQFGIMFFPDKAAFFREAHRVLVPGGTLAFNVWTKLDENPVGRIANEVIASFFPQDPPTFYQVPFGLDDQPLLRRLVSEAGFDLVADERILLRARSRTADAARGLVLGNPVHVAIEERGTAPSEDVIAAVSAALAQAGGDPLDLPMSAIVMVAQKAG